MNKHLYYAFGTTVSDVHLRKKFKAVVDKFFIKENILNVPKRKYNLSTSGIII